MSTSCSYICPWIVKSLIFSALCLCKITHSNVILITCWVCIVIHDTKKIWLLTKNTNKNLIYNIFLIIIYLWDCKCVWNIKHHELRYILYLILYFLFEFDCFRYMFIVIKITEFIHIYSIIVLSMILLYIYKLILIIL